MNKIYTVNPDVEIERRGEVYVLLRTVDQTLIRLSTSAFSILSLCDGQRSQRRIFQQLSEHIHYEGYRDITGDFARCFENLLDLGLISEVAAAPLRSERQWRAPVLITGCPRSGTTALSLLSTHREICVFNEYKLYTDPDDGDQVWHRLMSDTLGPPPEKIAVSARQLKEELSREFPHGANNATLRSWLFESMLSTPRIYGDKMPGVYLRHMDRLAESYPDAKCLVTVRDGRAVVASQIRNYQKATDQGTKLQGWMKDTVQKAESLWLSQMKIWLSLRDNPPLPCLEVRYEDAVSNPRTMLSKLAGFLEIDYRESDFKPFLSLYRPKNIDSWRTELPDIEEHLSAEFRDTLQDLGYS